MTHFVHLCANVRTVRTTLKEKLVLGHIACYNHLAQLFEFEELDGKLDETVCVQF